MTYAEASADAKRIANEIGQRVHVISARDGRTFVACRLGAPFADALRNGWSGVATRCPD